MKVINTMVLSLTVFDMFPQDKKTPLFDRTVFWRHSLGCGIMAKLLARQLQRQTMLDPEEAFCAGLLHDIGRIVMEQYLHDDFRRALLCAREHYLPLHEAEKAVLTYTHADLAEWLTARWNLPEVIRLPAILHHTPAESSDYAGNVYLCHFADRLCYEQGLPVDEACAPPALDTRCFDYVRLTQESIDEARHAVLDELGRISAVFQLTSGKQPPMAAVPPR